MPILVKTWLMPPWKVFTFFISVLDHYKNIENVLGQIFFPYPIFFSIKFSVHKYFWTNFSWIKIFSRRKIFSGQNVSGPFAKLSQSPSSNPVEEELSLILPFSSSPTHPPVEVSLSAPAHFYMKFEYNRHCQHKVAQPQFVFFLTKNICN